MAELKNYLYGEIKNNKLEYDNPSLVEKTLASLDGRKVQVLITRRKTPRSIEQNSYYWGVVIDILGNHFGYFPDEMHEVLKWKFLRYQKGQFETVRSTTTLNTMEFERYTEMIRIWALRDFEVYIPLPNENV